MYITGDYHHVCNMTTNSQNETIFQLENYLDYETEPPKAIFYCMDSTNILYILIFMEHFNLLGKIFIQSIIDDIPEWVQKFKKLENFRLDYDKEQKLGKEIQNRKKYIADQNKTEKL